MEFEGAGVGASHHGELSELLDLLDGARGSLLEGDTVHLCGRKDTLVLSVLVAISSGSCLSGRRSGDCRCAYSLVHVDGVLSGDDLVDGRLAARFLGLGRHRGGDLYVWGCCREGKKA